MAITSRQIIDFLLANPGMSDAQIVAAMEQYGVSPAQMATAVGLSEGEVVSRVAATVPEGQTITLGDTRIAPQYEVRGSGEDRQVGGIENKGKILRCMEFYAMKEDRIVFYTDGVTQSGIDTYKFNMGWGDKNVFDFVIKQIENSSPYDEDRYVKEYMAIYGIDNVRGGSYNQDELTFETIRFLRNELRTSNNECYKCGSTSHFVSECDYISIDDYIQFFITNLNSIDCLGNEIRYLKEGSLTVV